VEGGGPQQEMLGLACLGVHSFWVGWNEIKVGVYIAAARRGAQRTRCRPHHGAGSRAGEARRFVQMQTRKKEFSEGQGGA